MVIVFLGLIVFLFCYYTFLVMTKGEKISYIIYVCYHDVFYAEGEYTCYIYLFSAGGAFYAYIINYLSTLKMERMLELRFWW